MLCPGPNAFQHSTTIATTAMSANRYITWLTSSNEVNSTSRYGVSADGEQAYLLRHHSGR